MTIGLGFISVMGSSVTFQSRNVLIKKLMWRSLFYFKWIYCIYLLFSLVRHSEMVEYFCPSQVKWALRKSLSKSLSYSSINWKANIDFSCIVYQSWSHLLSICRQCGTHWGCLQIGSGCVQWWRVMSQWVTGMVMFTTGMERIGKKITSLELWNVVTKLQIIVVI